MKKAQVSSFDIMIAFVIFIAAFLTFFFYFSNQDDSKEEALQTEATSVLDILVNEDSPSAITDGTQIDESQLNALLAADYDTLRNDLRITNEFCIYLEDENGSVIPVGGSIGKGSPSILINGNPCVQ